MWPIPHRAKAVMGRGASAARAGLLDGAKPSARVLVGRRIGANPSKRFQEVARSLLPAYRRAGQLGIFEPFTPLPVRRAIREPPNLRTRPTMSRGVSALR